MKQPMTILGCLARTTVLVASALVVGACGTAGAATTAAQAPGTGARTTIAQPSVNPAARATADTGVVASPQALPSMEEIDLATRPSAPVSHAVLVDLPDIIAHRLGALGITNAVVGLSGNTGVVVELPSPLPNAQAVVQTITTIGLLEIIDTNGQYVPVGTVVSTTGGGPTGASGATPAASTGPVYQTIVTGADLSDAQVIKDQLGRPVVEFTLKPTAAQAFYAYTSAHVGQPMSIVLDKRVIETATIQTGVREYGVISNMSAPDAQMVAAELNAGALPVPVVVSRSRVVSDRVRVVGP